MGNNDQLVRKVLVLNPKNDQDKILIEYLQKKKFSTYVRNLIEADFKKTDINVCDNETLFNMIMNLKKQVDTLMQNNNSIVTVIPTEEISTEETHLNEQSSYNEVKPLDESGLTEEEQEELNSFEDIGINF